jgi:hypothetical protein
MRQSSPARAVVSTLLFLGLLAGHARADHGALAPRATVRQTVHLKAADTLKVMASAMDQQRQSYGVSIAIRVLARDGRRLCEQTNNPQGPNYSCNLSWAAIAEGDYVVELANLNDEPVTYTLTINVRQARAARASP